MALQTPPVKLKIALASALHTLALKKGAIAIEGAAPEFVEVTPIIGAFRRMVRDLEFDVCEMAPTTYMIARSLGAPFIALPVFLSRQFHFDAIVTHEEGMKPRDLEGERVGVRAYSVTTGVWARGMLAHEFGLDLSKVTWVVDDEEAVPQLVLPSNVERAPEGRSLANLFSAGELAAAFTGPAGIGREGPPKAGWDRQAPTPAQIQGHPLFPAPFESAKHWYGRAGIYPFHGFVVVKEAVLRDAPWIARSLYDAFSAAKRPFLDALGDVSVQSADLARYRALSTFIGRDPLPYGLNANRRSIEALVDYAYEQKLLSGRPVLQQLFLDFEDA